MSNKSKSTVITSGIYTFIISGRKIVVASRGNKDEEELRAIAKAYEHNRKRIKPLNGEFRWCMNPECNNAFYARGFKIKKGWAVCCCRKCAGKVFGAKKGERTGINTSMQHIRSQSELLQWFLVLDTRNAACLIVDVALNRNLSSIEELNELIEWQEGKIREIIREIFRPSYPAARRIIEEFCATKKGIHLRNLIPRALD